MLDFGLTSHIPLPETGLRLALALLLGGVIGFDRELRRRPAGLRTHMLVSLASAAFTVLTLEMFFALSEQGDLDPIRITEAIITGVAFLGAGTIIRGGSGVAGITTGASVWLAGAIGLAAGSGLYGIAALVALAGLFVLAAVGWVEQRLFGAAED